jgi:protein dithiol oxidoreductase (disulfide-forming)
MKRISWGIPLALFAFLIQGSAMAQLQYNEGTHYKRSTKPQPTETGEKLEVLEFFSFACIHCSRLEPHLQAWHKKVPADVQLRRIPVSFYPQWKPLAKVYYALEAMGVAEKLAPAVFEAIHRDGKKLGEPETFYAWAATQGVDAAKLKSIYEGFAVYGKVHRAEQLTRAHSIENVPSVIIEGSAMVMADNLKGQLAEVPAVIDFLLANARLTRKK